MAERKAVYRSVSYKQLESWKAKRRSSGEDLERRGALPPDATRTAPRKLSQISSLPKRSSCATSLSVRQLSQKFVSNRHSAVVAQTGEESFWDICSPKELLEVAEKPKDCCSTQESSDSDRVGNTGAGTETGKSLCNLGFNPLIQGELDLETPCFC